jgi:hypothetical protein
MTTVNQTNGDVLKNIISGNKNNKKLQKYVDGIESILKEEFSKENIYAAEFIGYLMQSFSGVNSPLLPGEIHCGGCDKILESLMVHFSSLENLNQLPEEQRKELPNMLFLLRKLMNDIARYDNIIFDCVNLYKVKHWPTLKKEDKEEIESWYKFL